AAITTLSLTLVLEFRFQWARRQVLQTEPQRLERLGRHLIVGFYDLEEVRRLVKLRAAAGIFLSARNVQGKSVAEVRSEMSSLQRIRREQSLPPLWIATDQEGGAVSRMSPPLSSMPSLSQVVDTHPDPVRRARAVREYASTQGRELAEIGVNLNFAPVVDINFRVRNPHDRYTRVYQRAISDDPGTVAEVADWYCAALERTGVRCTLKHFPGLGRVSGDTHMGPADLDTPVSELETTDWVPFRRLMREGRAFTMLSHVRLTALDRRRPVSTSAAVVAGMLRNDRQYEGILVTDDFSMNAVYRSPDGMDAGCVDALNAGVDLILLSWDPDQYYRAMFALLSAEERGTLDGGALRRSDERLARWAP
ncbi:MAG: glycoside hydrolase family 3 N-terminal domain-containing protein, partial [Pseudomonadota bacterium]